MTITWMDWDEAAKLIASNDEDELALIAYLKEHPELWKNGDQHQHYPNGAPVFDGERGGVYTMRSWGAVMGEVDPDSDGYYGDWAWSTPSWAKKS